MVESVGELSCIGTHEDACVKTGEVVDHVFHELVAISRGWVCRIVRWYGDTYEGSSCRDELIGGNWCD